MSDRRMQSSRDDRRRDRDGGDRDKRQRSRSPHGRGPPRRSNYDVDTYSSSRGYREREREDRYGGARRPGDREREWDRDRGSARRDTRRDDMDGRRRDNRRDLFEDRFDRRRPREDDRRDGGGDRDRDHARDRDDMRQLDRQQRQKSNSPPHKPREPTPDLTEVIPVLERRRRLNMWDVKPKGYENVTAGQAKLSGMFPLPGAPRQQPMDASRLQAFMSAPGNADASALKPVTSRQSRRLRVYNLPPSTTDRILVEFFNLQLNGLNITKGIDPCTSANVNAETSFAILEFKAAEDATHALALDGINMESGHVNNGHANGSSQGLRITRPSDYIMNVFKDDSMTDAGVVSDVVPETTNKICIANIPPYLDEDQVKELLVAFGALRSFVLAKDMASGQSRGFAFCEYVDADTATDIAVEGLDNMELGDSRLSVKRASVGIQQNFAEMNIDVLKTLVKNADPNKVRRTRVLCLYNIVTADDLLNPDDAEEIEEDVKEECEKFGEILALKIPRPSGARNNHGVGKVYVKYATVEEAKKAMENLSGRHFDSRTVVVSYFDEESFDVGVW